VGNTYRYDVVAQDVDGDAVTYALDTISQGKVSGSFDHHNYSPTSGGNKISS
jgi:hypothetical protein